MIVAGIDEAGYGPVLGPLVVGCAAFEVEGDPEAELPCLWKLLKKHVAKTRSKGGRKLHINDSKAVYAPASGLKELERSVLAVLCTRGYTLGSLPSLLHEVADGLLDAMAQYPWYGESAGEVFPFEIEAMAVRMLANALRVDMERQKVRCVHVAARVLCEGELNRMFAATRNKGSVLFTQAASHIEQLLQGFADKGLVIVCDRHGGRSRYGSLLRLMFPDWALGIEREEETHSEYQLTQGAVTVRLHFREKAEAQCLPVAFASMVSKYLREALMRRFNAYWLEHQPGIAPTAGYHGDGNRFLGDIDGKRREMGIADERLIRSR